MHAATAAGSQDVGVQVGEHAGSQAAGSGSQAGEQAGSQAAGAGSQAAAATGSHAAETQAEAANVWLAKRLEIDRAIPTNSLVWFMIIPFI